MFAEYNWYSVQCILPISKRSIICLREKNAIRLIGPNGSYLKILELLDIYLGLLMFSPLLQTLFREE